jgi:hypothetical protein
MEERNSQSESKRRLSVTQLLSKHGATLWRRFSNIILPTGLYRPAKTPGGLQSRLLLHVIDDRLRAINDFEVRRNRE